MVLAGCGWDRSALRLRCFFFLSTWDPFFFLPEIRPSFQVKQAGQGPGVTSHGNNSDICSQHINFGLLKTILVS